MLPNVEIPVMRYETRLAVRTTQEYPWSLLVIASLLSSFPSILLERKLSNDCYWHMRSNQQHLLTSRMNWYQQKSDISFFNSERNSWCVHRHSNRLMESNLYTRVSVLIEQQVMNYEMWGDMVTGEVAIEDKASSLHCHVIVLAYLDDWVIGIVKLLKMLVLSTRIIKYAFSFNIVRTGLDCSHRAVAVNQ